MNNPEQIVFRGATHIVVEDEFREKLASGDKLRVKLGIDPSGSRLTIGHAVLIWKLRAFQEMGHQIILVIGTFTGQIGDTSDKESERPLLEAEQVLDNMKNYADFAGKVLDMDKVEVVQNGDWFNDMTLSEFFKLQNLFSVAQMVERDNFAKRIEKGDRVGLHEFSYALLQGYDSVEVKADVEIGGNDQLFNNLAGRAVQKAYGQKPQDVVVYDLLLGSDGKKMSKTAGNCIWIDDEVNDMYGKVMRINDEQITQYYQLATLVSDEDIAGIEKSLDEDGNPRDIKANLAKELVSLYYGIEAAAAAEEAFNSQFRDGNLPDDIATVKVDTDKWLLVDLLVHTELATSKSEAKRLVEQGAVRLNQEKIDSEEIVVKDGNILQAGKRRFARISI